MAYIFTSEYITGSLYCGDGCYFKFTFFLGGGGEEILLLLLLSVNRSMGGLVTTLLVASCYKARI